MSKKVFFYSKRPIVIHKYGKIGAYLKFDFLWQYDIRGLEALCFILKQDFWFKYKTFNSKITLLMQKSSVWFVKISFDSIIRVSEVSVLIKSKLNSYANNNLCKISDEEKSWLSNMVRSQRLNPVFVTWFHTCFAFTL